MRMNRWLLLPLLTLTLSAPAKADEALAQFHAFFDQLTAMQAGFLQTVTDARGRILEEAEGEIAVQQPGRFRLAYRQPHQQLYIADGEQLWTYDGELAQASVRPQDEALDDTPALLLSAPERIGERFALIDLGPFEGFQWLELEPYHRDGDFERVLLAFRDGQLLVMDMADQFGQFTRLEFLGLQRNPELDAELFTFDPPPGTDILGLE